MAWGSNNFGELGDGSFTNRTTPVQVTGLTNVIAIADGGLHSLALLSDGTAVAWGYNFSGQLGGTTIVPGTFAVQVSGLANAKAIAAGGEFSLAIF